MLSSAEAIEPHLCTLDAPPLGGVIIFGLEATVGTDDQMMQAVGRKT